MTHDEKPDLERLGNSVLSTMRIVDPYNPAGKQNTFKRIRNSVAGLLYQLRRQGSTYWLVGISVFMLSVAAWLRIEPIGWAIIILAGGTVWVSELLNTSLEVAVNLLTRGQVHPLAKVSKDVGSAATFMATAVALVCCALVLVPPLMARLGGG